MKTEQIQKIKEIIKELQGDYDFEDVGYFIKDEDLEDVEELEDIMDYIEGLNSDNDITNCEIIYYSNAIKYLTENADNLNESIEIAIEYGYNIEQINSELLASLLMTRNNEDQFIEFLDTLRERLEAEGFE